MAVTEHFMNAWEWYKYLLGYWVYVAPVIALATVVFIACQPSWKVDLKGLDERYLHEDFHAS